MIQKYVSLLVFLFVSNLVTAQVTQEMKTNVTKMSRGPMTVSMYRKGEWSAWLRGDGLKYRYQWGVKTQEAASKKVDAIFEVEYDKPNGVWEGTIGVYKCNATNFDNETRTRIKLQPKEIKTIKISVNNCGSAEKPSFRTFTSRSVRID